MCRHLQLLQIISRPIRRLLAAVIRILKLFRCAVSLSPFPHLIVVIAPDAFLYPAEKGLKRCCSSHTTFCVRVFAVRNTLHVLWELSKLNGCQEKKNTANWITSSKLLRKLRLELKSLFDERVVFDIPNRRDGRRLKCQTQADLLANVFASSSSYLRFVGMYLNSNISLRSITAFSHVPRLVQNFGASAKVTRFNRITHFALAGNIIL